MFRSKSNVKNVGPGASSGALLQQPMENKIGNGNNQGQGNNTIPTGQNAQITPNTNNGQGQKE